MTTMQEIALAQIDSALEAYDEAREGSEYGDLGDLPSADQVEVFIRCTATIDRFAPANSQYREVLETDSVSRALGALRALRQDFAAGYVESLPELIHAELFGDFLEMAEHLLGSGYKDAAAVVAGSTLEGHLRQLAEKSGVEVTNADGQPLKADRLNADLVKASAYEKTDQKAITAWLGLRNDAAHGDYGKYEAGQVGPMIAGIRDFIRRLPA